MHNVLKFPTFRSGHEVKMPDMRKSVAVYLVFPERMVTLRRIIVNTLFHYFISLGKRTKIISFKHINSCAVSVNYLLNNSLNNVDRRFYYNDFKNGKQP